VLFVVAVLLAIGGCVEQPTVTKSKAAPAAIAGTWTFNTTTKAAAILYCVQCHATTPAPAGYSMPWNGASITGPSLQGIYDAIAYEPAPANRMLPAATKTAFLNWAVGQGATEYAVTVPEAAAWNMTNHIGGASNGSDAAAAGKFMGFRVEDLGRTSNFIVQTYTDRNNVTKKGIEFYEDVQVDQDSFSESNNPTNYIFVDGLDFNGRWKELTATGYVTQDRWSFIGFHTQEMKKGSSPFGAREQRTYVRLQVDRDWISWRGKEIPADETETYPWDGADPILTADSQGLNDSVFLNDDEWYRVDVSIADHGTYIRYYATVKTVGGTLKAEVAGTRPDDGTAFGSFFFGKYSTNNTGKKTRFAEWDFSVTGIQGGGTQVGCRECEITEGFK
jgi:hypothetical protein